MGIDVRQLLTVLPGRKDGDDAPAVQRAGRPRLVSVDAVARRRRQARQRVEALTIRETTGEEPRSRSNYPIPGGLVSSTRYLLERGHRRVEAVEVAGVEPAGAADE